MPRCFVAIPLPKDTRQHLVGAQPSSIRGMRLVGIEEMHLTLHFLGEISDESLNRVREKLKDLVLEAFTMTIEGVGVFPPRGRPTVLWVGVQPSAELSRLHESIGANLSAAIGFEVERRPYSPHITLARLNGPVPKPVVDQYLRTNQSLRIDRVPVNQFVLFSSRPVDGRYRHRKESVIDLT